MEEKDKPLVEEVSEVAQVETEPIELKGRAKFEAKFKENNPDVDYTDDEIFYPALEEYDNAREKELGDWRNWDERLRNRIKEEPRVGQFISNLMNGNDLVSSLIDTVGEELVDAINSPEAQAKIEEARKLAQQIEDERQANLETSQKVIDEFLADKDQADVDGFDDYILTLLDKLTTGKFDTEMLTALWKGYKHDEDVAVAAEDGEIRGRNETIMAKKADMGGGDGIPSLAASIKPKSKAKPVAPSKGSIWDAGKQEV